jgi:hypothetical protein
MTKPPDDNEDEGTAEGTALYTERHDELIRKMLEEKRATLSPEQWRSWGENLLTKLTETVIVERGPKTDSE